jgi:DHA1 family bicyclomycin/chloramphenicol resistance-like MFS transporter
MAVTAGATPPHRIRPIGLLHTFTAQALEPRRFHPLARPALGPGADAGRLGTLGPFSIDTYLPAFDGIARTLGATPLQMQQTLSAYLFGFAAMNLFHGALADSFGRRPVILGGLVVFTLASVGCALTPSIGGLIFFRALQGMSTGAGMVVSRAIIRDMFAPADAQRVMSR